MRYPFCCPCWSRMMMGEAPDVSGVLAVCAQMDEILDVTQAQLKDISVPVHGIAGSRDPEMKYVQRMKGIVPNFTSTIIPKKGHDSSLVDPLYKKTLIDFVKQVQETLDAINSSWVDYNEIEINSFSQ